LRINPVKISDLSHVDYKPFSPLCRLSFGHETAPGNKKRKTTDAFHKIAKDRKVIPDPIDDRKFQE